MQILENKAQEKKLGTDGIGCWYIVKLRGNETIMLAECLRSVIVITIERKRSFRVLMLYFK